MTTTETIREELLQACELFYRDVYRRLSDQNGRLLASCTWTIHVQIEPLAIGIFVRLMGPACVYGQVIKTRRKRNIMLTRNALATIAYIDLGTGAIVIQIIAAITQQPSKIVYLSKYFPGTDGHLVSFTMKHLGRMFPKLERNWLIDAHNWRAIYSQPIVERNYSSLIPNRIGLPRGVFVATMAQI